VESTTNLLLRGLDPDSFGVVQPYLQPYRLVRGAEEAVGEDQEPLVLFPERGVLNLLILTGGTACPIAVLGREGLANHHVLFPQPRPSYRVSVQVEGSALAISARDFRKLVSTVPQMRNAYLSFVSSIEVQVASTLRSSMSDTVERRLARLLLMFRDRIDDDLLPLLHSHLSNILGVRRASITDALHRLEGHSAISNRRGVIAIRHRAVLEVIASTSYGAAEIVDGHSAGSVA
jgi:CRP-like cAMP-binding protein